MDKRKNIVKHTLYLVVILLIVLIPSNVIIANTDDYHHISLNAISDECALIKEYAEEFFVSTMQSMTYSFFCNYIEDGNVVISKPFDENWKNCWKQFVTSHGDVVKGEIVAVNHIRDAYCCDIFFFGNDDEYMVFRIVYDNEMIPYEMYVSEYDYINDGISTIRLRKPQTYRGGPYKILAIYDGKYESPEVLDSGDSEFHFPCLFDVKLKKDISDYSICFYELENSKYVAKMNEGFSIEYDDDLLKLWNEINAETASKKEIDIPKDSPTKVNNNGSLSSSMDMNNSNGDDTSSKIENNYGKFYISPLRRYSISNQKFSVFNEYEIIPLENYLEELVLWYDSTDINVPQSLSFADGEYNHLQILRENIRNNIKTYETIYDAESEKFKEYENAYSYFVELDYQIARMMMTSEIHMDLGTITDDGTYTSGSETTITITDEMWNDVGKAIQNAIDFYFDKNGQYPKVEA